jgi:hypothetical protein
MEYLGINPSQCGARTRHIYDPSREKYALQDDRDENGDFTGNKK